MGTCIGHAEAGGNGVGAAASVRHKIDVEHGANGSHHHVQSQPGESRHKSTILPHLNVVQVVVPEGVNAKRESDGPLNAEFDLPCAVLARGVGLQSNPVKEVTPPDISAENVKRSNSSSWTRICTHSSSFKALQSVHSREFSIQQTAKHSEKYCISN